MKETVEDSWLLNIWLDEFGYSSLIAEAREIWVVLRNRNFYLKKKRGHEKQREVDGRESSVMKKSLAMGEPGGLIFLSAF